VNQGTAANQDLLRLLDEPVKAASRAYRPFLGTSHEIRVCVAAVDVLQIVVVGMAVQHFFPVGNDGPWQAPALALMAALLAGVIRRALRIGTAPRPDSAGSVSVRAALAVVLALAAVTACVWAVEPPRQADAMRILAWTVIWAFVSGCVAYAIRHGADAFARWMGHPVPALALVGPVAATRTMEAALLTSEPSPDWRLTASLTDSDEDLVRLVDMARHGRVDVVAVAVRGRETLPRLRAVCERLADQPVRVCLALDVPPGVEHLRPTMSIPLLDLQSYPHHGWPGTAKRVTDLLAGSVALLMLAPLFALVALAIRLESPGSPFFAQWRFGKGSHPVKVWKFRTMDARRSDPTGGQRTLARDPRVTRVGRFLRRTSIDELPQLINVLRGEMSLVGPRPHPLHMRIGDTYYFDAVENYRIRHSVKPGITGWAQINGSRGEVDTLAKARRRVELDRWYLDNWSLMLDLRIVLRTALGGFRTKAD
jgi:exopolysaccharide biosynthesis polyprenyl glycosylphosphotransferase